MTAAAPPRPAPSPRARGLIEAFAGTDHKRIARRLAVTAFRTWLSRLGFVHG